MAQNSDSPAAVTPGEAPATSVVDNASEKPPPTKEQCLDAHHKAQTAQLDGKLILAREMASICASSTCPSVLIGDCAHWLSDIDQQIPSVVFEVRVDGEPNVTASVFADGNQVPVWSKGEALRLDPGQHEFRFELSPRAPIEKSIMLTTGMQYRVILAEFVMARRAQVVAATPLPAPAPPPVVPRRTPTLVYPMLGIGALGVAGFTTFALVGKSKQNDLEQRCMAHCTDEQMRPMKTHYLIADLSLGVGLISLAAAATIYFWRSESPASATVGVAPLPHGAQTFATYTF
jgi:hypothetical protein